MPKILGDTNICAICNREKPLGEFARGHRKCKECYKVIQKNNYAKRMRKKKLAIGSTNNCTNSANSDTEPSNNATIFVSEAARMANKTGDSSDDIVGTTNNISVSPCNDAQQKLGIPHVIMKDVGTYSRPYSSDRVHKRSSTGDISYENMSDYAVVNDKICNVIMIDHNNTGRLKWMIITNWNMLLSETDETMCDDKIKLTQIMLSLLSRV